MKATQQDTEIVVDLAKTAKLMSTVTIHVPEEKEEILLNFLRSISYITIETELKLQKTSAEWRSLEGKYSSSGITSETLTRENEEEKKHDYKREM